MAWSLFLTSQSCPQVSIHISLTLFSLGFLSIHPPPRSLRLDQDIMEGQSSPSESFIWLDIILLRLCPPIVPGSSYLPQISLRGYRCEDEIRFVGCCAAPSHCLTDCSCFLLIWLCYLKNEICGSKIRFLASLNSCYWTSHWSSIRCSTRCLTRCSMNHPAMIVPQLPAYYGGSVLFHSFGWSFVESRC